MNFLNDFFDNFFNDLFYELFHDFLNDFLDDFFGNVFFNNRFHDFFNRFFYDLFDHFFYHFFNDFFRIVHDFVNHVQSRRLAAAAKRIPRLHNRRRRRTAIRRTSRTGKIKILQTKFAQSSRHFSVLGGQIAAQTDLTALASGNFHVIVNFRTRLHVCDNGLRRLQSIHHGKIPRFAVQFHTDFAAGLMIVQTAVRELTQGILRLILDQATRHSLRIAAACRRNIARARTNAKRRFQALFFHHTDIDTQNVQHPRKLVQGQNHVHAGVRFFPRPCFQSDDADFLIGHLRLIIFFQQFRTYGRCARQQVFCDFGVFCLCQIHPFRALGRIHGTRTRFFVCLELFHLHQGQRIANDGGIDDRIRAKRLQDRRKFSNAVLTAV